MGRNDNKRGYHPCEKRAPFVWKEKNLLTTTKVPLAYEVVTASFSLGLEDRREAVHN